MENIDKTNDTVTISKEEYDSLKKEIADLNNLNIWYREQLESLKKNRFGSKSEYASNEVIGQLSFLFDEAEAYAYLEETALKETTVAEYSRAVKKNRKFIIDTVPEGTAVVKTEHRLSDEERICPNCGNIMDAIGSKTVRSLEIKPAEFIVHEDIYFTYACKKCENGEDLKTTIKETPHEISFYPGSCVSPSLVSYLMVQKYVMGSPLYRLEKEFERQGYNLSRQTMSNWIIHCSDTWLKPVYDRMHEMLLDEPVIHADETTLQVLNEPGRKAKTKSYMWLYRSGKYCTEPKILFEYCPGRGNKYPADFLKGYTGYLQTDGYSGYDILKDVTHVGCMAHLKRKFHEAVSVLPEGKKTGTAVEGEAYCTRLLKLEEEFKDLSYEERYRMRQEISKPIFDEFIKWSSTRSASSKSKLGVALTYLKNNAKELGEYLNDGMLEATNNLAERSIKMFVIDRKNFLFANTPKGADSSAVTFSIIQTAKENGLDPFRYLIYIFETAPKLNHDDPDWVDILLPKNAPLSCKA